MSRSFNVLYRFLAKDSFSGVSKKIKNNNKKLSTSFKKLDRDMKTSGRSFKGMSGGFVSGFRGMAAAALGFFSIKGFLGVGAGFQDALADLSAITGSTGKDLDNLREKILSMAKTSVTSQADVAEAVKLVASAKPELLKNIDALTATTDAVLLLKNAAGIELADAANITAQSLNIFGAGAKEASRFVNVLAAGAKLGSSEIADTGAALLIAGPGARAAGLSFEQLNAAIQTVAKGGIKGTQAGTALNAIFGRMRRLGIDFQKLGLEESFNKIAKALDNTTSSTERAKLEARIFGEEHAKVGLAILDNTKLLTQYSTSLAGTNIAQEQSDIRLATFSARFRKLGIILKDVVIRTFLRLEPMLTSQATAFGNFLDQVKPEQVEAFADSLGVLVRASIEIGKGFGVVLDVLVRVGKAIGEVSAAIATLDFSKFTDLTKNTLSTGLTFSPIQFFGDSISDLFNGGTPATTGAPLGGNSSSTTDINLNVNAPAGVVQSMQSTTQGRAANVGLNLREE